MGRARHVLLVETDQANGNAVDKGHKPVAVAEPDFVLFDRNRRRFFRRHNEGLRMAQDSIHPQRAPDMDIVRRGRADKHVSHRVGAQILMGPHRAVSRL